MTTWYFAWVDSTETVFSAQHQRMDEDVFEVVLDHAEGDVPKMTIQIRNPRVGPLSTGRKTWAWLGWVNPRTGHPEGVFFGHVISVPSDVLSEIIQYDLEARPLDFLSQQQTVAESLKVSPGYDPVFFDPAARDDPTAILTGYSFLYHVDRVTLEVTVSDIISGEDGTVDFGADEVFYDNLKQRMDQGPLQGVNVVADVSWTQQATGIVNLGQFQFLTYTGQSVISDWPKPGAAIGSGWSCLSAVALDVRNIQNDTIISNHFKWHNNEDHHVVGDTMDIESSKNAPLSEQYCISQVLTEQIQIAIIDAYDPNFHDIPTAFDRQTLLYIPEWEIQANLVLRYDASRQRTEQVTFTLMADVQPVNVPQDSPPLPAEETITVSGNDVGLPLINVRDWRSVRGQSVSFGQVVYPNNPTILGGTAYQICVEPGVAGTGGVPAFSDVPGTQTVDGTVRWVSLGNSLSNTVGDWQSSTYYPVGSIVRPLTPLNASWNDLVPPPRYVGSAIGQGQVCSYNGFYFVCTVPGTTGVVPPDFNYSYGVETQDYTVTWVCVGSVLPVGETYFVAISAGVSREIVPPLWDFSTGAETEDNGVVWRSLGSAGGFIDLPIGDLSRSSFFPTDRGLQSIEHLLCRARARLRRRARCTQTSWECSVADTLQLSCRMNAQIHDPRLPGGVVVGKVIAYHVEINLDRAEEIGSVTIASAVGYGGSIVETPGTAEYIDDDYIDPDYYYHDSPISTFVVGSGGGDVGYTPPVAGVVDDGLSFPLTQDQAVKKNVMWGDEAQQKAAIAAVMPTILEAARLQEETNFANDYATETRDELKLRDLSRVTIERALAATPIWLDLELAPLNNGPFGAVYQLITTDLQIEKQIDYEASSS